VENISTANQSARERKVVVEKKKLRSWKWRREEK